MSKGRDRRFGGKVFLVHLLYDVAFLAFFLLALPYFAYRLCTSRRYRAGLLQRLGFVPRRPGGKPAVWVHGVSAGEVKAVPPLMARIAREASTYASMRGLMMIASGQSFSAWNIGMADRTPLIRAI